MARTTGAAYPNMVIDTSRIYTLGHTGISIEIDPDGTTLPSMTSGYMSLTWSTGIKTGTLEAQIPYSREHQVIAMTNLPLNMAEGFPSSMSGNLYIVLNCYTDGVLRTRKMLEVPVNIRASDVKPTCSLTVTNIKTSQGSGLYQYLDGIKLTVAITTKYGASVRYATIQGTDLPGRNTANGNTHTINPFTTSGSKNYALAVEDSRGQSASASISNLNVTPYIRPSTNMTATRYQDETGTGLQVIIKTNKAMRMAALRKQTNGGSWINIITTYVPLIPGTNTLTYSGANLNAGSAYVIEGTFTDGIGAEFSLSKDVPQAYVYLYLDAANKALGVGGKPANNEVMISSALGLKHGTEDVMTGIDIGSMNQGSIREITGLASGKNYLMVIDSVDDISTDGSGLILINLGARRVRVIAGRGTDVSVTSNTSISVTTNNTCEIYLIRIDR